MTIYIIYIIYIIRILLYIIFFSTFVERFRTVLSRPAIRMKPYKY